MVSTAPMDRPGFQPASLPTTAEELLGRLLLMQPVGLRGFDTKHGPSEATLTHVVDVDTDGSVTDLGERAIFWQLVRRQLTASTPDRPWIAGRLVQSGHAYRLDPPTEEETLRIIPALTSLPGDLPHEK